MTNREVLAFDLYGTLVDPIAISGELSRVLGEHEGRETARLWRLKHWNTPSGSRRWSVTRTSPG